jgi:replicative DNA helicase
MNKEQFFNVNLENNLLGMILNDGKILDDLIDTKDDVFYNVQNKKLFITMKVLWRDNKEINVPNIHGELKTEVNDVGGVGRLNNLLTANTGSNSYKNIAKVLEEYRVRRELFKIKAGMDSMFSIEKKNDEIINLVLDQLDDLMLEDEEDNGDIIPTLERVAENIEVRVKSGGKIKGIETGLIDLDRLINGLNKQEMIIVAARPGQGKTTLANNIAINVAKKNKHVAIFNLEMSKEQIFEKILSNVSMVECNKISNGSLSKEDWLRLGKGENTLIGLSDNMKVYDRTLKIDSILAKAKKLKKQGKLDVLIIDYLQLVEGDKKQSREQEVSSISRKLKQLSKELNISVIALSQLSRAPEQRADHRPILSDLRESGAIEQDSDVIIFCYRDEYYNAETEEKNIMEMIIGKNRNGAPGIVKAAWVPQYQRISNLEVW